MADDLAARLLVTFVQEMEEQVGTMNAVLLEVERDGISDEAVRSLFRVAHTIKGAARVAAVYGVEQLCHALESVFADVRAGRRTLDGGDFALLFACADALSDAVLRLRASEPVDDATLESLVSRLVPLGASAAHPSFDVLREGSASTPDAAADTSAPSAPSETSTPSEAASGRPAAEPQPAEVRAAERAESSVQAAMTTDLVRVRADRLDSLLGAVGELVIATGRIASRSQDEDVRRLERVTDDVAQEVRRLRLRPFSDICEALPRAVRDVAAAGGRQVRLELTGQDVETDRAVMDALREPLLHIVRNAVDHGVEPPAARAAAGKPEEAVVRVGASLNSGRIEIFVSDDGAGLDEERIRESARAAGRAVPRTREEIAATILQGRLSTRTEATAISGRGVGVDLARTAVERMGGALSVEWEKGQGTTFRIECPPTSATLRALLVRVGTHLFAVPTTYVERLQRIDTTKLRRSEGGWVLPGEGVPVRVATLAALLGPPLEERALDPMSIVMMLHAGNRRIGVVIDEALTEEEIIMRPLALEPGTVPAAIGAALLPSGRLALVLATGPLVSRIDSLRSAAPVAAEPEAARVRVLVADDSITTRTLEQSVLEAAGYEVFTAVNGEDAWRRLEEVVVDAVISDVEMPKMDGIALCRRIRASAQFRSLPVILVTGLGSEQDRSRGLEAGADAYIVKAAFNQQELLTTLSQLVSQ